GAGVRGIGTGRMAVAPAEIPVGTDIGSPQLVGAVVDVELAGLDGAGACRGRQADAASAHADPLPQAVRPHDRAPGGCVPPMTSLAVTLAVTLVGYRVPTRLTTPASPPCPVSLALSTPSPSPRGNLLAKRRQHMQITGSRVGPAGTRAPGTPRLDALGLGPGYAARTGAPSQRSNDTITRPVLGRPVRLVPRQATLPAGIWRVPGTRADLDSQVTEC